MRAFTFLPRATVLLACLVALSTPMVGLAQSSVAPGGAAPAKAPQLVMAESLLANRDYMKRVAHHVKMPRYGFFILKDGLVSNIYGSDGVVRVTGVGHFTFQGSSKSEDGRVQHFHAGIFGGPGSKAESRVAKVDEREGYSITIKHPRVNVQVAVECLEYGPNLVYYLEEIDFTDAQARGLIGMLFPVHFSAAAVPADGAFYLLNDPMEATDYKGWPIKIHYDTETYAPYGNGGRSVLQGTTKGVVFFPRFPQNEGNFASPPQQTVKVRLELP